MPLRKENSIAHSPDRNSLLGLDGELALGEVRLLLLLLLGDAGGVGLGQAATDGPRLLRAQVERQVLLLRVEQAQLVALVGVDHGQGSGDGFAEVVSIQKENVSPGILNSAIPFFHLFSFLLL